MKKFFAFIKDSFVEVKENVSWPKYSEVQANATLVLVASLLFALVIGLVDFGFREAMQKIYQSVFSN
ncbi:preprotein translocase subunit SecE [Cytophagaceae bacterium DM2B3-1]|uniref:Protein translocase subunit SecE n=2 Tax=Xanthocytophaga TaxID=3078918 RepID=A0AAE3QN77_9BACT|nr:MULTISPECIES: preprotein translocase subunit SecE [Xanthocytophaga]MDJ1468774.1 preprotein translocase subunit SecE [Xanthocytophaga flavus]MDJ1480130.1 preprotein translocase subunit SecE [Xanthocytophaga flavus]MDJ1495634.1 preprotein translocase subunit SecE [Xanthocytophaga flavus]MDJ1503968.1 preprotein translocase subunit SecE [Xanthocytophaga agilis]